MSPSPLSPPWSSNMKRHLRPSLGISYSQPPPRMDPPPIVHMTPDPKLPTSASSTSQYNKRPHASTKTTKSSMSISATTIVTNNNSMSGQESSSKTAPKQFIAPAHPQSHHLHTLPPREKTTRTLILDHTAWRHGRTRFAQGRCELGMRVRIKGKEGDFQVDESNIKRPAFYIGNTSSGSSTSTQTQTQTNGVSHSSPKRRYSDFGELPEVDVMSSDDDEDMDSAEEGVSALSYGKRYRERKKRRQGLQQQQTALTITQTTSSSMQVDSDEEDSASDDYDDVDNRNFNSSSSSLYQDARFAPLFAARANGMEKVLCSILRDTPSPPPRPSTPPPYSIHVPYANTQHSFQSSEASRVLPNGLRLRLALLELINDLFERQGCSSSYEQSLSGGKDNNSSNETKKSSSNTPSPSLGLNVPPPGLVALVQVSNQPFFAPPTLPSFRTLSLPSSSMASQNRPSSSSYATPFGGSGSTSRSIPVFSWTRNSTTPPTPSPLNTTQQIRDKDVIESSTGSSAPTLPLEKVSRSSPITLRGPAPDLPASWTDQVPKAVVASGVLISSSTALLRRASGRAKELYAAGCYSTPTLTPNIQTYRTDIPTFSYRGNVVTATPFSTRGYSFEKLKMLCPRHLRQQCRVCEPNHTNTSSSFLKSGESSSYSSNSPATSRIGAGLLKKHRLLRERGRGVGDQSSGSVLADLLPRFLRLSALVAIELGREARGEEPEARSEQEENDIISEPAVVDPTNVDNKSSTSPSHAQPTRAWFALLCGLITRAVLEGYLARGWKGADYIEILMGIGLGIKGVGTRRQSSGIGDFRDDNLLGQNIPVVEDPQDEFDPDEMPGLIDACKILFNGLVRDTALPADSNIIGNNKTTGLAEQEYVQEMEERMSEFKFLAVSHPCPDLATHLTQLSEKYPAEPVERSALRFCEAIANWRGKPELEMYKKIFVRHSITSTPALPIRALLASPAPHKPPIQRYFTVPFSARKPTSSSIRGLKRQRSVDEEVRELKKERYETRQSMDVDSNQEGSTDVIANINGMVEDLPNADWVGPYGV
ncbi:hypothetical protein Clacol_002244 [Clathrus columnatus]|uniref:Uncharacterized protein n=1 Tax=Clathrus columnatus TaxID=1419009 RepID=A0AAV5A3L9_9AGAM|nr:hypothetical protein Clacol_002244 [Clathrus columnatus]